MSKAFVDGKKWEQWRAETPDTPTPASQAETNFAPPFDSKEPKPKPMKKPRHFTFRGPGYGTPIGTRA